MLCNCRWNFAEYFEWDFPKFLKYFVMLKICTIPVTSQSVVCVITPTVLRASHILFVWHHTRHMCDILCTADDIVYTLSNQTTVFMSHPLQAWHHTPCMRHCTHCIFVITTSTLISHPLLHDITPSFSVTSYALYRTSHPILMSSQYCTYDITASIYETTSRM